MLSKFFHLVQIKLEYFAVLLPSLYLHFLVPSGGRRISNLWINRFDFFRPKFGIQEMCRDQWNWAKKNPYGYQVQDLEVPVQKSAKFEALRNGQIDI